jgi:hypothetical protein
MGRDIVRETEVKKQMQTGKGKQTEGKRQRSETEDRRKKGR